MHANTPPIRKFDTGATRNAEEGKLDFEGFLSPLVLERYAKYMDSHRRLPDGSLRDSDNWQCGIPLPVYMKSAWRHFFDLWREHRGIATPDGLENDACALLFNISGYLHEHLKASANTSRKLYDETSAIATAQDVALEDIDWNACFPTRAQLDAKREAMTWSPQRLAEQGIPAESAYLASFGPNTTQAEALREIGIGDVEPTTLRGIPESFIDMEGNWITRRNTQHKPNARNPHVMAAEALRDEYEKTDRETGV